MNKHSLSISSNQKDSIRQGYHLVANFPRNCRTDDGWLPYLQIMLPVSFIPAVERKTVSNPWEGSWQCCCQPDYTSHKSDDNISLKIKNSSTRFVRALCLKLWLRFGGSHLCNKTINARSSLALIEDLVAALVKQRSSIIKYLQDKNLRLRPLEDISRYVWPEEWLD